MKDLVRDSIIGQAINKLSSGRLLPYPDQRPGYQIPERYLRPSLGQKATITEEGIPEKKLGVSSFISSPAPSHSPAPSRPITPPRSPSNASARTLTRGLPTPRVSSIEDGDLTYEKGDLIAAQEPTDPYLVGWNGPNDPDNPK